MMGRFAIFTACLLAASTLHPNRLLAAKTYGLVIGIDQYDHVPDLDGAVNDAVDISGALIDMGAEVVTLLDHEATRDAVLESWRSIAKRLQPGDRLIVSYAGHGSHEPEHYPGNEDDGRDENLLLSGFAPFGPDAAHRIRDDELAELISLSPQAEIILVADACHSGTLSRAINPVLGYRYVTGGKISDDPLPPPPPNTPANDGEGVTALFLAAVDESDKVPEFLIDGKPRGALSYSFANGLRGAADLDSDGRITKGELTQYIRLRVRGISQGIQSPKAEIGGNSDDVLVTLRSAGAEPKVVEKTIWQHEFSDLPVVKFTTNSVAETNGLNGVEFVAPQNADLIYDRQNGQLTSSNGDLVAKVASPQNLQPHIDKARLANALAAFAIGSLLEIQFGDGDRLYLQDDVITLRALGRQSNFVTLFNLASTGSIDFIYPLNQPALGIVDPAQVEPSDAIDLPLQISPPFGADHVVAIETSADPVLLRRVLATYNSTNDIRTFWEKFSAAMRELGDEAGVTIFPFFTAPS